MNKFTYAMIVLVTLSLNIVTFAETAPLSLPDALTALDGTKITTAKQWEMIRRPELVKLFEDEMYGKAPTVKPGSVTFKVISQDDTIVEGTATLKTVEVSLKGPYGKKAFEFEVFVPNGAKSPVPAFLVICHRRKLSTDPLTNPKNQFFPVTHILSRGYAGAIVYVSDLAPDSPGHFKEDIHSIYDEPGKDRPANAWGTIAAWSFLARRAMDYLQTDKDIDGEHIAVIGHSRGGKTSLLTGALDTRFALTISNDSGCTGAAIARRKMGERVAKINDSFPHWFCDNYSKYDNNEDGLPVDQHELIALMAPRLVYVASAENDAWADPKGEFMAAKHAGPVYKLYNLKGLSCESFPKPPAACQDGDIAYHIRTGGHGLRLIDWDYYMDYTDKHWK